MGFERRRREKYEIAGKFAERMKRIQKEAKAVLEKAQKEMKKFANRRKREGEEYRVGDLVLLSTKDLKWQMKGRRSEKLTEYFVGLCKIKGIVSSNAICGGPTTKRIHSTIEITVNLTSLFCSKEEWQKKNSTRLLSCKLVNSKEWAPLTPNCRYPRWTRKEKGVHKT